MKPIERELDKLVQLVCLSKRCAVCGKPAECGHHLVGRANKMLRYNIKNILPVCYECHWKIHEGKINQWYYTTQQGFLSKARNTSYKDFLLFVVNMTEDEYLKSCRDELRDILDASYKI